MSPNSVNIWLILILSIWSLFWKGLSLWRAAKGGQHRWFIALIILLYFNTLGLMEIIFLFKFAKHPLTIAELKHWLQKIYKKVL